MNGYLKTTSHNTYRRYCKILNLQTDKELIEKYKEVHAPGNVWPEIIKGMKEIGIIDMEIYIHGNVVFMIMDTLPDFDHDEAMKLLALQPKQREWEKYVSAFQNAGSKEDSPEKWKLIEKIFTLL